MPTDLVPSFATVDVDGCDFRARHQQVAIGDIDPEGFTLSQFADLFKAERQYTPEDVFLASHLLWAVDDWQSLMTKGRVKHDPRGRFSREDAEDLFGFLFDDKRGLDDENYIPIRLICCRLAIELSDLRTRLLSFGGREKLDKLKLKTRGQLRYRSRPEVVSKRAMKQRQITAARRDLVFKRFLKDGCPICDGKLELKAATRDERYVHLAVCE